ncbi:MAG TPA: ABC transporter substrate-binding protein [Actinomycetota bacterium]|nr:ABC transporter substrate-binding protein [Actinomycetota bacterium]
MLVKRSGRLLALLLVLGLLAAACGGGETTDDGDGGAQLEDGVTLTFGTSADPVVLDGALVSDGESLRAIDQIFEGLVTLAPGGTELEPALAESWEISDDGLEYTFNLRDGVKFHDGTDFNADAVCFNFERWYNFKGSFQNESASYYYQTVFGYGGFANKPGSPENSNYAGCEATDDLTVVLRVKNASTSLLGALTLPSLTIASPAALQEFDADAGKVDAEGIFRPTGTFATEHPIGTGAYKFEEWVRGDHLTLVRNEDYWGEFPGNVETLIFKPIPDPAARLQALQTGEIQGYDLVDPQDYETITGDENLQLLNRPAFNVGYVGFNQAQEPLDDIAVRQAIAHAINRQEVVDAFYAGQGVVAKEFMPPELFGYADDVTEYEYDPDKAKQLLEDAGYTLPVEINFAYPTDVERPYMPDPQANFEAMVADLEDCCFKVNKESATWSPDYLDNVNSGRYGAYLLGWTGDFADPDNFVGTFFQDEQKAWAHGNKEIYDILDRAEAETDEEARIELYEEANRLIMEELPGLPYVHTQPGLAFAANVTGYQPSPISLEPFRLVTVE